MNNNSNNPQRTSPRFAKSTSNPQYYESDNNNASATNNAAKFLANSNNATPIRAKKRNTSSSIFSPMEEQVMTMNSAVDPEAMQIYIQKLDLLYQNLEVRVQKLESIVADQFFTVTSNPAFPVISRNSQIDNSGSDFNMSNFSISSNSTTTTANSVNNLILPSLHSAIPSTGGTSIRPLLDPSQKEISKSDLDDYCLPLLQKRATPSIGELNAIVMNLKKLKYPDLDNKFILSKVREWFRRKREYMSQRIFNICSKKYGHLANDPVALAELTQQARNNPIFVGEIIRESNLEILNEASAWEFCSEKITSYLENLPANIASNSGGNFQSQF